jgi:hypothetical protein
MRRFVFIYCLLFAISTMAQEKPLPVQQDSVISVNQAIYNLQSQLQALPETAIRYRWSAYQYIVQFQIVQNQLITLEALKYPERDSVKIK